MVVVNLEKLLVVGLGNPGEKYRLTRHNIGWMVVEKLIEKYKAKIKTNPIYYFSEFNINNTKIIATLPTTYMNNSGEAVLKLKNKYNFRNEEILTVVDEYNFPLGRIHMKLGGSDGGHNGIASIIEKLGSKEFIRLRCGIDKNFGSGELVNYVLSPFEENELEKVKEMIENSIFAIETLTKYGLHKTMNLVNQKKQHNS